MSIQNGCECLDRGGGAGRGVGLHGFEEPEDAASDVALERAEGFGAALAVGAVAGDVVACAGVDTGLRERDDVQGAVELAVAGAVEAVAALFARGGVQRRGAGIDGQLRVGLEALDVADFGEQAGGRNEAAAGDLQQRRPVLGDQRRELALERLDLAGELA
jgi:hypothetical protein